MEPVKNAWPASLTLAQLYAKGKDNASAIEHLKLAMSNGGNIEKIKPWLADLYRAQATELKAKGNSFEARQQLLEASRLYPENSEIISTLIFLELSEKKYEDAQKILNEFSKGNENQAEILYLQGSILIAQGKSEAQQVFRKSWSIKPLDSVAEQIYKYEQLNGKETEASQFLHDWNEKISESYRPKLLLALNSQKNGDVNQAITWYEKTLAVEPRLPVAANNLAWLYFEQKDARALELAEKAKELEPNSPEILDTYGWILINRSRRDEGLLILEKAASLAPKNKEIQKHLEFARNNK